MPLGLFLKERYHVAYGLTRKNVSLDVEKHSGTFTLHDEKACAKCRNTDGCNHETLVIKSDSGEEIYVVDFEKFASQFSGTTAEFGETCDYLMYSNRVRQVAFCDLSCSCRKYVEPNQGIYSMGKRAKASSQMTNSMLRLTEADDLLKLNIISASRKRFIFGWREPDMAPADLPEEAMLGFIKTPDSTESTLISQQNAKELNFEFIQVKYPEPYLWDFDIF